MKIFRLIRITTKNFSRHAFRSCLAALGVVLGVAAVVAMTAISEGARRESLDAIIAHGIDNIIIRSLEPKGGSFGDSGGGLASILEYGITEEDILHIKETFENIRMIIPVRDMRKNLYVDAKISDIKLVATIPEFLEVSRSRLIDSRSRFLNDQDSDKFNTVCVLGKVAARKLFKYKDPIGKYVSV
ncbi:ABC transporter permease, partial [Verrucomicrobiota bacterium]